MNSAPRPTQIVLAEDNPADVGLVREALREHDVPCDLRVLSDGASVVAFIDALDTDHKLPCPDLLLLDLSLPKHNGRHILRHLRSRERCAQIPVVVLTSSDWKDDRQIADENAVMDYFQKPSSLAAFMQLGLIVKGVIGRARPSGS